MLNSAAIESSPLSQGVTFNFSYSPGVSLANFNGIKNELNQAAATWASYLKENRAVTGEVRDLR